MRKEIDRVLGNSLRCILPSYWWKRLLGKMVDKIESAENSASSAMTVAILAGREASDKQPQLVSGSNIKTINHQSILGSGNIIVDTDKVEKYKTKDDLDANGSLAGGDIATVVDALLIEKPFTECYQPTRSEIEANPYNKKFTKVDGISLNPDFNPNLISLNYGSLSIKLYSDGKSKGYHKEYPSYLEIECDYDRKIYCWEYAGTSGSGHRLYDSSGFNASNIDRVNNILREGSFRFSYFEVTYRVNVSDTGYTYYYSYSDNFPSDATAMIDSFVKMIFAETQNADVYVRSKEWEKLTKEQIVASKDELDALEAPKGSIAKIVKGGLTKVKASELFLSLETAVNWDKYTIIKNIKKTDAFGTNQTGQLMLTNGEMSLYVMCSSETCYGLYTKDEVETQINLDEINQMLSEKDFRCVYVQLLDVVDSCLELYTQTPVVSDAYIKGETWTRLLKEGDVTGGGADITIDSELSDTSENPVQNKAVTNALAGKADASALENKVDKVSGKQLSTEDFTTALKAKLEGLNNYDDTSIQNSVNSLTTQINTLVSGDASVAIESFNEIIAFLNGVEDSESLDSIIASIEQQISNKQNKIEDLETIRSGATLGATAIQEHQDISHLATKEELTNLTNEMVANEEVHAAALNDLNNRLGMLAENVQGETVTKEEFETAVNNLNESLSGKADAKTTSEALTALSGQVETLSGRIETSVTSEQLSSAVDNINNTILENEEVTAAALNDLKSQIIEIITRLNNGGL